MAQLLQRRWRSDRNRGGGSVAVGDFSIDLRGLRLGALVRIQGRVKEYRERSQCVVNALQLCVDPNVESLFWLDHARLGEEIEARADGRAMRSDDVTRREVGCMERERAVESLSRSAKICKRTA